MSCRFSGFPIKEKSDKEAQHGSKADSEMNLCIQSDEKRIKQVLMNL